MPSPNRFFAALFLPAVFALLMFVPLTKSRAAADAASASITPEERAHLVKLLKDSQAEYLAAVENVSDEQWKWKSAPDRWSVGETAEHIMLAESLLFGVAQRAIQSPPNPDWQTKTAGKTEVIEQRMLDRSHKATAPEPIRPSGLTKAEVIRRFKEARAQTIQFAETTQVPLKEHTFDNPFPVFGTLNAYQWFIYIPMHNMRHDLQIAEVKATAGYPQ
jgi:hypothetical protein